jgi:DNA-directed RNA polymerase alpha subunit
MKKAIKDYFPNEEEDDIIILDTNYSPVKLVNSQVDELTTDPEKKEETLTLTIDTNGMIEPYEVLQEALKISQSYFSHISQLINDDNGNKKRKREELEPEPTAEKIKKVKI